MRSDDRSSEARRYLVIVCLVAIAACSCWALLAQDSSSTSTAVALAFGFVFMASLSYPIMTSAFRSQERDQAESDDVREQAAAIGAASQPSPETALEPIGVEASDEGADKDGSRLDFERLSAEMLSCEDPIDYLKRVVGDIVTRQAEAVDNTSVAAPGGIELFLARGLQEAGLFNDAVELPHITVVRPRRSGMFYLRVDEGELPYLAKLRVIEIESVLNRVRFAHLFFSDPAAASEEDVMRANQGLDASIASQAPDASQPAHLADGGVASGEYALREGLATGIESFQLPYRLTASFRSNVADGLVAIEIDLPPEDVFPKSTYSTDLGRVIPTTGAMRAQAASAYGLRLGLLLAAQAFRCAPQVTHVFVAGVCDTPTSHSCLYSVDFDRDGFERLDLAPSGDPLATYRAFGATMDVEPGGELKPVRQGFGLEEERFCPTRRYEPMGFSNRELDATSAKALGTSQVSGLAISEDDRRERLADEIGRQLSTSTEKNVRVIMDLAGADPDPSVRNAARRTVSKLIEGSLPEQNPLSVEEEFVAGDDLTKAVERAMDRMMGTRHDSASAIRILREALDPIDEAGTYRDDDRTSYRYFANYVERTLFNRMFALPTKAIVLVPDAYFEAQLLLSAAYLDQGQVDKAAICAGRAYELDPLDDRSQLRLVRCAEFQNDFPKAIELLDQMLLVAHDPENIGVAYYRMAFMQWKSGNVAAAQACYLKSQQFASTCFGLAALELRTLVASEGLTTVLERERIDETLTGQGIPVAPTEQVGDALLEGTKAAIDSEVFPVARNLATLLGALTGDDVMFDIIRSMELEPDR